MLSKSVSDFNGILLYTKSYREHDLLIKFFTEEFGKKMFLVRGAKRPNFKMRAAVLPFSYGLYTGDVRESGLSYIKDGKHIHHFQKIGDDIVLNAYATYTMSLLDMAFPDGEVQTQWYDRLFTALNLIESGFDPAIITNIMEIQLLQLFGVAPNWVNCAICHRTDLPFDYSEAYGGLLCKNHWNADKFRLHLDAKTIYYLRLFSAVNLHKLAHVSVSAPTKKALRHVIDQIYERSVGVVPKSRRFLEQLGDFQF